MGALSFWGSDPIFRVCHLQQTFVRHHVSFAVSYQACQTDLFWASYGRYSANRGESKNWLTLEKSAAFQKGAHLFEVPDVGFWLNVIQDVYLTFVQASRRIRQRVNLSCWSAWTWGQTLGQISIKLSEERAKEHILRKAPKLFRPLMLSFWWFQIFNVSVLRSAFRCLSPSDQKMSRQLAVEVFILFLSFPEMAVWNEKSNFWKGRSCFSHLRWCFLGKCAFADVMQNELGFAVNLSSSPESW